MSTKDVLGIAGHFKKMLYNNAQLARIYRYPYLEVDYYVLYREPCPWLPGADDGPPLGDDGLLSQQ